jgi:hypothetical protein
LHTLFVFLSHDKSLILGSRVSANMCMVFVMCNAENIVFALLSLIFTPLWFASLHSTTNRPSLTHPHSLCPGVRFTIHPKSASSCPVSPPLSVRIALSQRAKPRVGQLPVGRRRRPIGGNAETDCETARGQSGVYSVQMTGFEKCTGNRW